MNIIMLIIGFILVIKGADWLVDGASSLARKIHVSDLIIGLTVVAFGTSMPEFVVNLFSSINKTPEIAIGNVLGSNIANILLILGISAIIYPLRVKRKTVWKEIPFSLLAAVVIGLLANDILIDGGNIAVLGRIDGLILLSFFIIFMYYTFGSAKDSELIEKSSDINSIKDKNEIEIKEVGLLKSLIFIIIGLVFLILGGNWIVLGAIAIAQSLGVSASLIGLTIVAIGTALPELATSAIAAWKKNSDIAIGNVVGSNIFNIFWILGISSIIYPLPLASSSNFDILMVIISSLILFFVMFIGRRHLLERWQGAFMVLSYCIYLVFLIYRG